MTKRIPLTKGKFAIVDDCDYDELSKHKWQWSNKGEFGYACRTDHSTSPKTTVYMHRVVCPSPEGKHTDHINRNGLDNRRINLRSVTPQQNSWNQKTTSGSSIYRGVIWSQRHRAWIVRIRVNNELIYLGQRKGEAAAAALYDKAALRYFGEFATLNLTQKETTHVT